MKRKRMKQPSVSFTLVLSMEAWKLANIFDEKYKKKSRHELFEMIIRKAWIYEQMLEEQNKRDREKFEGTDKH